MTTRAEWLAPEHLDALLMRYDQMLGYWPVAVSPDPDGMRPSHLRWMLREMVTMQDPLKFMRWLGFIQARLVALELTTVQAERDFTRPIFKGDDSDNES